MNSKNKRGSRIGRLGMAILLGGSGISLAETPNVVTWGVPDVLTIPASLTDVKAVAAGNLHVLALKADGTVVGWGDNLDGQLNIPAGLSGVVGIAAGGNHSLAVKSDGTVVAWGSNLVGESNVPAGLSGVTAVAAATFHSLALKSDGTVVAWGGSSFGVTSVPAGLSGVIAIAAARAYSLALKSNGTVVAWGNNIVPAAATNVIAIAAGDEDTLALKADGTILAWGGNTYGEATVPAGLSGAVAIAASWQHNLALKSDGTVVAWGDNTYGETTVPAGLTGATAIAAGNGFSVAIKGVAAPLVWGDNTLGEATIPPGLTGLTAISSESTHTLALRNDGTLALWGGLLSLPSGLAGIKGIASGGFDAMALKSDGTVVAWGQNSYGEANVPAGLAGVKAVSMGEFHSLALKSDGTVVGWGDNTDGEASPPAGLSDVVAIAAGGHHSLALKSNGKVVAWGSNSSGESAPPSLLTGVVAIAAGGIHSLALKSDGTVVAWGDDTYGQTTAPDGLSGVAAISGGKLFSLVLKSDGTIREWGNNSFGQLNVPTGLNGVTAIAGGAVDSVALTLHTTVAITIASDPVGLPFTVTGQGCQPGNYSHAPVTLQWLRGASCSVTFPSPSALGQPDVRYIFSHWADDSSAGNSRTIIAPNAATSYTADFIVQLKLTTSVTGPGGTITPAPEWVNAGTTVTITAQANSGYVFAGFSRDLTGLTNPQNILMNIPHFVSASFALVTALTVATASGQYSDPVTPSATIAAAGGSLSGSLQFAVNGVNLGGPVPVGGSGTYFAPAAYTITQAPATYTGAITAIFTGGSAFVLGSSGAGDLVVSKENATAVFPANNPLSVEVSAPGGNANSITLVASIQEEPDGSPGNITLATPSFKLIPVVAAPPINCPVTTAMVSGAFTATAICANVPVNVYDVSVVIGGNYYTGTADSTLLVYDPSLGYVTGGGQVQHNGAPANFAINVKYLKNGQIQGGMLYIEHRASGDVVLKSNALTGLSIVANTAVLLSKATLNGAGNYSFQATAIDNGSPGTNDLFGLQVTGPGSAAVPDLSFAPLNLSGGSIQVPHN